MSRHLDSSKLEAIFGIDNQTIESEELLLDVHLTFVKDPSSFTLYGVTLDHIDPDGLLNFLAKVMEVHQTRIVSQSMFCTKLSHNLLVPFATYIRMRMYNNSTRYSRLLTWDKNFINALLCVVLNSSSPASWKRIMKQLMNNDLISSPNFDGSKGIVPTLLTCAFQLSNCMDSGVSSIGTITEALNDVEKCSKWMVPSCVTILHMNHWTLLHLAASTNGVTSELLSYLIVTMGCGVNAVDSLCQNSLHVAAASLNCVAVRYLSKSSAAAVRGIDIQGRTPLDILLRTISLSNWQKRVSSHELQRMLITLIPSEDGELLWKRKNITAPSEHHTSNHNHIVEISSARSSAFFMAVAYTDDFVAEEVIRLARKASASDWDAETLLQLLWHCIRCRGNRSGTVEMLLREFIEPLYAEQRIDGSVLDLLDTCLCHAVVTATRHVKKNRPVLEVLLSRFVRALPVEQSNIRDYSDAASRDSASQMKRFVFLYLAVAKKDTALLTHILSTIPRALLRRIVYPQAFVGAHTPVISEASRTEELSSALRISEENKFVTRMKEFCDDIETSDLHALFSIAGIAEVSSMGNVIGLLSFACIVGGSATLSALLRASYSAPTKRLALSGRDEMEQSLYDHFYPALISAQHGASVCLQTLKSLFAKEAFFRLCFCMQDSISRHTVFHRLQRSIYAEIDKERLRTSSTSSGWRTSPANFRQPSANLKSYCDCLKILLDCVPSALSYGSIPPLLLSADLFINSSTASSAALLPSLRAELESIKLQMHRLSSITEIHKTFFDAHSAPKESLQDSGQMQVLAEKYEKFCTSSKVVVARIREKSFQTNIRRLVKQFHPNKNWVKLAYCLIRSFKALELDFPFTLPASIASDCDDNSNIHNSADQADSEGNIPESIDLTGWNAFYSMLGKICRSKELLKMAEVLETSIENAFHFDQRAKEACNEDSTSSSSPPSSPSSSSSSPAQHSALRGSVKLEAVARELSSVEKIFQSNRVVVLLRETSSSGYDSHSSQQQQQQGGCSDIPHYQWDDTKPDYRADHLYNTFLSWLLTLFAAAKLRAEFTITNIPFPSTGEDHEGNDDGEELIEAGAEEEGKYDEAPNPVEKGSMVSGPVTTASLKVTVLEYIAFRRLLHRKCRIEHLISIATSSREFSGMNNTSITALLSAVPGTTACPLWKTSRLINKLVASLLQSGVMPSESVERRICESFKQKHAKSLEQIFCVLIEYNDKLGGDTEGLVTQLLPLSAMGMWSAVELILRICKSCKADINRPEIVKRVSCLARIDQHAVMSGSSSSVLTSLEKQLLMHHVQEQEQLPRGGNEKTTVSLDSLIVLTPLHFAVYHGKERIIKHFMETFSQASVDLSDIVRFAVAIRAVDMVAPLVAHSVENQSSVVSPGGSVRVLGYKEDAQLSNHEQRHHAHRITIRGCSKRVANVLSYQQLLNLANETSTFHNASGASGESVAGGQASALFVTDIDPTTQKAQVHLMDGRKVEWDVVRCDAELLSIALPAAQSAGGVNGSGHTILHDACASGNIELFEDIIRRNSKWVNHLFSVDKDGSTPLGTALTARRYTLAVGLLREMLCGGGGGEKKSDSNEKKNSVEQLYISHTAADMSSGDLVRRSLIVRAEKSLYELECEFNVPRLPIRDAVHLGAPHTASAAPDYGLKGYKVENCQHALSRYLVSIGALWNKILSSDAKILLQVFHLPACAQLDSVIRARQALALLGIPLSQLTTPADRRSGQCSNSINAKSDHITSHTSKDFSELCPHILRNLVSWPSAMQLRGLISGWYRLRSAETQSSLDDTLFIHRNTDVSIAELGYFGAADVNRYLVRTAAYTAAAQRVRSRGVPSIEKAKSFSNLCALLKPELRFDTTSACRENFLRRANGVMLDSPLNPKMAMSGSKSSEMSEKVLNLLQTMQIDAETCERTLALSYTVLDFVRVLSIARQLVSITSEPYSFSAIGANREAIHPLDRLHRKITTARSQLLQLKTVLLGSDNDHNHVASQGAADIGVRTRVRVCDSITQDKFTQFLSITPQTSERFNQLRELLIEGLACVLQDHGEFQLSEFVCRASGHPLEEKATSASDAYNPSQQQQLQLLDMSNKTDAEKETERATTPTTAARSNRWKIVDTRIGIQKMLEFLHHLRVSDLIGTAHEHNSILGTSSRCSVQPPVLPVRNIERFVRQYSERILALQSAESKDAFKVQASELVVPTVLDASQVLQEVPAVTILAGQSGVNAYTAKRNQEKRAKQAAADLEHTLSTGYDVAKNIFQLITISAHMPAVRGVYEQDVSALISKARTKNPLVLALIPDLLNSNQSFAWRGLKAATLAQKREIERECVSQLGCCDVLLELGVEPSIAHGNSGFAPVEVAALSGLVDVLKLYLSRSQKETLVLMPNYRTLVWHVLLAAATALEASGGNDGDSDVGVSTTTTSPISSQHHPHHHKQHQHQQETKNMNMNKNRKDHYACVEVLLAYKFPADHPVNTSFSCLEIALITQAPRSTLAALVIKRVPMTEASALRSLGWLSMREKPTPLQVIEALLFSSQDTLRESLLGNVVVSPYVLVSDEFNKTVLSVHAALIDRIEASSRVSGNDNGHDDGESCGETVEGIVKKTLQQSLGGLLQCVVASCRKRLGCKRSNYVMRDLTACAQALVEGRLEEQPDLTESNTKYALLLSRYACSAQKESATFLANALEKDILRFCAQDSEGVACLTIPQVEDGGEGGGEGRGRINIALVDMMTSACYGDSLDLLKSLIGIVNQITEKSKSSVQVVEVVAADGAALISLNPDSNLDTAQRSGGDDGDATCGFASSPSPELTSSPPLPAPECAHQEGDEESDRQGDVTVTRTGTGGEDEDEVIETGMPDKSTWNSIGYCHELRKDCTMIEAALEGHSTNVIRYLCNQKNLTVSLQLLVTGLVRAQINQPSALSLLMKINCTAEEVTEVIESSGETILHLCCRRGYVDCVRHLLSIGADPMTVDAAGCTALVCSVAAGQKAVTKALYKYCPELVQRAVNVLCYAFRKSLLRRFKKNRPQ